MSIRTASILLLAVLGATGCSSGDSGGDDDDDGPPDGPLEYTPIVEYTNFQFQGRPVVAYLPQDARAVAWLFHGTNGSVGYANKLETIATTNLLIPEGIGFICSESFEQGEGNQWMTSGPAADNVDALFLLDLFAYLAESDLAGPLELDTPHYTIGFSNGGDMAGYFSDVLLDEDREVLAVAPHSSGGHVGTGVPLPMIFVFPVNDDLGRSAFDAALPDRENDGLRTESWEPPEVVPLTPLWWTRNPTVTEGMSQNTFDEMVRLGLIDEAGYRLVDVADAEQALIQWEKDAQLSSATLRSEETQVAWALHRMNGYYAREVRDFFLDFL